MVNDICNEYEASNISLEALAKKYHIGKLKLKQILAEKNIPIKTKGAQKNNNTLLVSDWSIEKYPLIENEHYIAIAKDGTFETTDYMNKAGVLTSYIKKTYNIEIPSLYFRRRYYMENGNYWWEQWFTIKSVLNDDVKKCPYCDWSTKDVNNNSGALIQHLNKVHNITKVQYLSEHPEDVEYFTTATLYKNLEFEYDKDKFVTCAICGRRLSHIGGTHLKTHNISKEEYIKRYGDNIVSNDLHNSLSVLALKTNSDRINVYHSQMENILKEYIISLGFDCETNRKILKGKEIDLFIPSKNIGFEIDGLYWHNECYKASSYHLNKTKDCNKLGITLYHIFEDELDFKMDIVKSRIANILGVTERKIYARKCIIREIEKDICDDFLTENHIQGKCVSKYRYGLFYDDELVSVMTFGNLRSVLGNKSKDGYFELLRFSNKLNTSVVGGASRLLKHFIKVINPNKILSYADRRWSNGNLYEKLGFIKTGESRPNYFYVIGRKRNNRFAFRKSELIKQGYDKNKSEHQIMLDRKIYRIYDCGTLVYQLIC